MFANVFNARLNLVEGSWILVSAASCGLPKLLENSRILVSAASCSFWRIPPCTCEKMRVKTANDVLRCGKNNDDLSPSAKVQGTVLGRPEAAGLSQKPTLQGSFSMHPRY